jgi:hypothetical protein
MILEIVANTGQAEEKPFNAVKWEWRSLRGERDLARDRRIEK